METKHSITQSNNNFTACRSVKDLAGLLNTSSKNLSLLVFEPLYYQFSVPKKNGKSRSIEAPNIQLKNLQRKLVQYLNAVYFLGQSEAAFGYICKVRGHKKVKNIYTNAKTHLGNPFLLNMDFEDFFHQISKEAVTTVFSNPPFQFNIEAAHLLSRICTFKGRLPMGAPTSPVLSNLYAKPLDTDLFAWAIKNDAQYTRYVDDLSFSSDKETILSEAKHQIEAIGKKHNLHFNPEKTKTFGPKDVKKITGLVLNETVDIDPLYYTELDKDIERLKHVIEVFTITGNTTRSFIKTFKQEVMGKINFIATIEGYESPQYSFYMDKFQEALNPPDDLFIRWTQFSNYT